MLDLKTFYDQIRPSSLFHGTLSEGQVAGMDAILNFWNSGPQGVFKGPVYDSHLSYMLATVYHETAQRMTAVREGLSVSDNWRKAHLRYFPYYGRGLVQLTWKGNYEKMAREIGEFIPRAKAMGNDLDLALDPEIAVAILFYGMSRGSFTGKSLHSFIHGKVCDFYHSRQIINGMDRAHMVEGYAKIFNPAVKAATAAYHGPKPETAPEPVEHPTSVEMAQLTISMPKIMVSRVQKQADPNGFASAAIASALDQV